MERLKFKSRIWIESGDNILLGPGRVALLKAISNSGSLSNAARSLDMSYKKAWSLIDAVNKSAPLPVVIKTTGGKNGGGSALTSYGKKLIAQYDRAIAHCWELLDQESEIFTHADWQESPISEK